MTKATASDFREAMEHIYGPFEQLSEAEASTWTPPPMAEGHRARYLWTDGFAVVNFLTLYKTQSDARYLSFARRLIETAHDILGRMRDGSARLPGATDDQPLLGGLRIGKEDDEEDSDGDGQYFHYLTVWMFALNRMAVASGDRAYNDLAISLAKAVHPRFMVNRGSARPRMFWKMSIDLSRPLVRSEGNLDPIDGYVVYSLLQKTAGDSDVLSPEIADYKKILDTKWQSYSSSDPLDLGMTLWTSHWFGEEQEWSTGLTKAAFRDLRAFFLLFCVCKSLKQV